MSTEIEAEHIFGLAAAQADILIEGFLQSARDRAEILNAVVDGKVPASDLLSIIFAACAVRMLDAAVTQEMLVRGGVKPTASLDLFTRRLAKVSDDEYLRQLREDLGAALRAAQA